MTVIAPVRAALVAAISAQVPTVQVSAVHPGEDTELREAIWVDSSESEFEWRSLGAQPALATRNRTELVRLELRVHVYREGPDQTSASEAAMSRAEGLLAEVEDALEADFSLGSVATHALVTRWSLNLAAREKGWAVDGRVTVEATNHPT